MADFGPSEKGGGRRKLNGTSLLNTGNVGNNSNNNDQPSGFIPPSLATLSQA